MNQNQALTDQDINDLKAVMQGVVSDLQKFNEPKPAKGCRWVEYRDERTGLIIGEYK